jgi:hypothetical protein
MSFTRVELTETFMHLDEELIRLKSEGQPEEVLWDAFEQHAQMPSSAVNPRDRSWWWEQVYSAMERHGLTELSRRRVAREFS